MTHEAVQFLGRVYHHKFVVMKFLNAMVHDLIARAETHDDSKFNDEEFNHYVELARELSNVPYGTPENEAIRVKYKEQGLFSHHWKHNRHHPEHFSNGVEDMTLVDLMEMLVDWKAASLRGTNDINKSIQHCAEKYNISPQLVKILANTAKEYKM